MVTPLWFVWWPLLSLVDFTVLTPRFFCMASVQVREPQTIRNGNICTQKHVYEHPWELVRARALSFARGAVQPFA